MIQKCMIDTLNNLGTIRKWNTKQKIQLDEGPELIKEQKQLNKQMGFSYRQCIGELFYALTICRIDISIAITQSSIDTL